MAAPVQSASMSPLKTLKTGNAAWKHSFLLCQPLFLLGVLAAAGAGV